MWYGYCSQPLAAAADDDDDFDAGNNWHGSVVRSVSLLTLVTGHLLTDDDDNA